VPYVKKRFDELESRAGGAVKLVRRDLGITAFGAQIFDFPEGAATPEHDEAGTGQEELYVHLAGAGWLEIDGERVEFEPETVVLVPPGTRRRTVAGPGGLRFLCVGGAPGRAYEPFAKFS